MLWEDPRDMARLPCRARQVRLNRAVHTPHNAPHVHERCLGVGIQHFSSQLACSQTIQMLFILQKSVAIMVSVSVGTLALDVEL